MPVTPIDLASLKPNPNPVALFAGDGGLFAALLQETDSLLAPKPEFDLPAQERRDEEPAPFDERALRTEAPREDSPSYSERDDAPADGEQPDEPAPPVAAYREPTARPLDPPSL